MVYRRCFIKATGLGLERVATCPILVKFANKLPEAVHLQFMQRIEKSFASDNPHKLTILAYSDNITLLKKDIKAYGILPLSFIN